MNLTYHPFGNVKKLGIDTSPIIYFIEKNPAYIDRMRLVMRHLATPAQTVGYISVLALAEILVQPFKLKNLALANKYERILRGNKYIQVVDVNPSIARKSSQLRPDYGIKTPDAIHIATAIISQCDSFLTNDKDLRRIKELNVIIVDDLTADPKDFYIHGE